jgi:hypothetical protein
MLQKGTINKFFRNLFNCNVVMNFYSTIGLNVKHPRGFKITIKNVFLLFCEIQQNMGLPLRVIIVL